MMFIGKEKNMAIVPTRERLLPGLLHQEEKGNVHGRAMYPGMPFGADLPALPKLPVKATTPTICLTLFQREEPPGRYPYGDHLEKILSKNSSVASEALELPRVVAA